LCLGGYFNEIQAGFAGSGFGNVGVHDTNFFVVFVDQKDSGSANIVVDAKTLCGRILQSRTKRSTSDGLYLRAQSINKRPSTQTAADALSTYYRGANQLKASPSGGIEEKSCFVAWISKAKNRG
jgi:hypothetical protein